MDNSTTELDPSILRRRENQKRYRESHKEAEYKRKRLWREKNKDRIDELRKAWRKNNPDKLSAQIRTASRIRRARLKNTLHSPYTEPEVLDLYGVDCHICGLKIDLKAPRLSGQEGWEQGLHIDHLVPISQGGSDTLDNIRPSHGLCNVKKGSKQYDETISLEGEPK